MKLNEFEERLATVSDAKLRQMLTASRASGPEVAVKLIVSECKRRGLDASDANTAPLSDEPRNPGADTIAYPHEHAGYGGADAPPRPVDGPLDESGLAAASEAPATAPDWLNEERNSGMPIVAKVLILLVVLGAILAAAWKFTH